MGNICSAEPEDRPGGTDPRARPDLAERVHALMLSVHLTDDVSETVDAITRAATDILGFALGTVLLARSDGLFEVASVSGHLRARDALLGTAVPLVRVRRPETVVERLGEFELTAADEPTAPLDRWYPPSYLLPPGWQPGEILQAPLFGGDGSLVAVLRVDGAPDGLRPDPELVRMLDVLAVQTGIAVRGHLERLRLRQEVELAQLGQEVMARAAESPDVDSVVRESGELLRRGMAAQRISIRLTGNDPDLPRRAWVAGDTLFGPLPERLVMFLSEIAERLWRQQRALVIAVDKPDPALLPGVDIEAFLKSIDARGVSSALMAPIGASTACYGYLLLLRAAGEPVWTEPERYAAQVIARGLGTALLNASLAEKEREYAEQLRAVDEQKRALFATISHEFQGPLSAIVGHAELLEDGLGPDDAEQSVSSIARNALRLQAMIADLMVLQQAGSPERSPDVTPVDLVAATAEALDVLEGSAESSGVAVDFDSRQAPVLALGDPVELGRVVTNLVGNAVKYSAADSTVTVRLDETDGVVRFTCQDEGIGITPEDQKRLFEQFFRSGAPEVRRQRGTGLGLAIVKRIVERHGGSIDVDSAPGQGSTFTVTLPAARVAN